MRVLLVTRRAWPAIGGIETLVRHAAQGLQGQAELCVRALRIDDEPTTVLVDSLDVPAAFTPFRDGPVLVEPLDLADVRRRLAPLAIARVRGAPRFIHRRHGLPLSAWYARQLAPVLDPLVRQADVVHMYGDGMLALAVARGCTRGNRPLVITPFAHAGRWGEDATSAMAYRMADRVLALQPSETSLYMRLGVAPQRIEVARVGVPAVTGVARRVRDRHGIEGPLVLFLGGRSGHKGHALLVAAARATLKHLPQLTFAFVGPGPPLETTHPRVIDVGPVSGQERDDWLDAADLLCLPSAHETLGLVVPEAWSARTPVLVSRIEPLTSLVSPGGGFLTDRSVAALTAALRELMVDQQRLSTAGAIGRGRWEREFSVPAAGRWHIEELYGGLVRDR